MPDAGETGRPAHSYRGADRTQRSDRHRSATSCIRPTVRTTQLELFWAALISDPPRSDPQWAHPSSALLIALSTTELVAPAD
jgi:hypothetical protein